MMYNWAMYTDGESARLGHFHTTIAASKPNKAIRYFKARRIFFCSSVMR